MFYLLNEEIFPSNTVGLLLIKTMGTNVNKVNFVLLGIKRMLLADNTTRYLTPQLFLKLLVSIGMLMREFEAG